MPGASRAVRGGGGPFAAVPPVYSPVRPAAAWIATLRPGDALARLREVLREHYHADHVVLLDSGTHALQLALSRIIDAAGISAVALPAFTCYDVATAGLGAADRLEFYDIDPDTLEPEAASFEDAVSTGVAAAVLVHQYGLPLEVEEWRARARRHGAEVVEDAAQGHGGSLGSRPLGSLAPYSVLSFGRGKGWTGGGGGALLTRGHASRDGHDLARTLSGPPGPSPTGAALRLVAQWALARPGLYGLPRRLPFLALGETPFHQPTAPRPLDAAVARTILSVRADAEKEAAARKTNAAALRDALAGTDGLWLPPSAPTGGYLRLPLRFPGRAAREVLDTTASDLGVMPSYPIALPRLPGIQKRIGGARPYPGAETLAEELFTAPTHTRVFDHHAVRIAACLERDRAGRRLS